MTNDPRVPQLLDELLASNATPEAVCKSCPELLPEVHKRWRRIRRLCADLDTLFPSHNEKAPPTEGIDLPRIPGYEVEGVLGRGGMGIVFRARHLRLNRPVALKMVIGGTYAESRERARFQRETEAAAGLRHPNIVQVYDVGEVDGQPYFTMEFIAGPTLAQKLAATPQQVQQAARLVTTLAEAVQAAHTCGIVHRDLKPTNILLTDDGTPKITDFGLARRVTDAAGLTQSGFAVGTPSYMAPEQARGRVQAIGPEVDVYSLGAILYEMLTGRPPFRGETPAETVLQVMSQEPVPPSRLNISVPHDLETICLKCLSKEPSRRYRTAAELATDLSRFQRGEPILARPVGPIERLVKWARRHPSLAASLVSGMLLLNGIVAVVVSVLVDRSVLTRTVEADLREVVEAEQRQAWDDARNALERARGRLGDGGPEDLRRRASQMDRELTVVGKLREIRESHWEPERDAVRTPRTIAAYESAFREAGVLDGSTDAGVIALRIRSTDIAPALLVALDDWASRDDNQRDWLFEIARQVEPNLTSQRIRDPELWNDKHAIEQFALSAPLEDQSVPFLLLIARKIGSDKAKQLAFLKRVQLLHPTDFETNSMLAHLLVGMRNPTEGARYYQAAIATRPTVAWTHFNLGKALYDLGRMEDALAEMQIAVRLSPEAGFFRNYVSEVLVYLKRTDEAIQESRRASELEPHNALFLSTFGRCLAAKKKYDEALDVQRRAIALDPKCWQAHQELRDTFLELHQPEKACVAWREVLALEPSNLDAWDGYAELSLFLGDEAEYRRVRKELLSRFGDNAGPRESERVGRACLFLPASADELQKATNLIERALASEENKSSWLLPYFRFAKALAEYRAGRQESALALLEGDTLQVLGPAPRLLLAMVQHRLGQSESARKTFNAAIASYNWNPANCKDRESWMCRLLRREAEATVQSNQSALPTGKIQP